MSGVLNPEVEIKLWVGENHMTAIHAEDTYFTRIIDERFPDFDSVIPKDNDKNLILFNKKRLLVCSKKGFYFFKQIDSSNSASVNHDEDLLKFQPKTLNNQQKQKKNIKG